MPVVELAEHLCGEIGTGDDPELLARHHDAARERGAGPAVVQAVAAYLAAEQRAGRIAATTRPETVAELLVGVCLHRAFQLRFAGETATPHQIRRFAADVVTTPERTLEIGAGQPASS